MLWLYISALVVVLGAELNAALETQTIRDSTTGPDQPLGRRGAEAADSVPAV
jgi:membrane protein